MPLFDRSLETDGVTPHAIMLVEAEILVRQPLAEYLRECGYQVIEAANAAEARLLLGESGTSIDLVFADVGSGAEGDGFALAGWIRANYPGIQIILAGSVDQATRKAGALCADGPELSKPYEHHLILGRIRRSLAFRDGRAA